MSGGPLWWERQWSGAGRWWKQNHGGLVARFGDKAVIARRVGGSKFRVV